MEDMTGMIMATSATTTPSSTSMAGMDMNMPMDHSNEDSSSSMGGMKMGMQDMVMIFFTSTTTPLYSNAWTPSTTGQYAGAVIFLVVLSVLFRGLIAIRCNFSLLWEWGQRRGEGDILSRGQMGEGTKEGYFVVGGRRPWRVGESLLRAALDTVLAGVSYLLMLAVMTMNVGYFMAILGGTFSGSFVVGGWTSSTAH